MPHLVSKLCCIFVKLKLQINNVCTYVNLANEGRVNYMLRLLLACGRSPCILFTGDTVPCNGQNVSKLYSVMLRLTQRLILFKYIQIFKTQIWHRVVKHSFVFITHKENWINVQCLMQNCLETHTD